MKYIYTSKYINKMKPTRLLLLMIAPLLFFTIYGFQQHRHRYRGGHKYVQETNLRSTNLPTGYNTLFAASGECLMCHENIYDNQGNHVGILSDWRSTMMANSAKDPLWQAKVSHEVLVNPGLQTAIEDKCTRCHAPAANADAHHNGAASYSMAELDASAMARDGVNCTVCHQITPGSMGNYSGDYIMGEQHQIWGPYTFPLTGPMFNHTGYTPTHSAHIKSSKLCASCHTLITHSVTNTGTPTGNSFVEQAIYHEWLNSTYPVNGTSCQTCHVPEITEPVVISTMPGWFNDTRTPFGLHHFVGANVFMQKLLKENTSDLGVTATEAQFDTTISRTLNLLQNHSAVVELEEIDRTSDSLYVDVSISNLTGHKFPSGFPSRRVFLELIVSTTSNDTLFHSGKFNSDFNIVEEDSGFEPHYNAINSEDQVQIYEMVMADFQGNQTTVLLYADSQLKDNRLVPSGFSVTHASYDTVTIVGAAATDPNFNHENNMEGSGTDRVHFHIPVNGNSEDLTISAKLYYQTTNDKWLSEMFSHSSSRIDTFKAMYENSDRTPILVDEASLTSISEGIESLIANQEITIFPNPASDYLTISSSQPIVQVNWYDSNGKLVSVENPAGGTDGLCKVPVRSKGMFYVEVCLKNTKHLQKIILI
jgi:hypothetical protein